jgi:putative molybdopterin biosynthesis protein
LAAGAEPGSIAGYEDEVTTHEQAARAVAEGAADVALGILPAARSLGLSFVPLLEERYDLITPRENFESDLLAPLLARLRDEAFKRAIADLGGYATRETGAVTVLAA